MSNSNWRKISKQVTAVRSESGDGLGRFRWNNGLKVGRNKSSGMWYAKNDAFQYLPTGWSNSLAFEGNGFEAPRINLIPLLKRSQPFSVVDSTTVWHTEWRPNSGMRIYTEVLCAIEGYNAPLVMTGKGWAASRITHYKRGCFGEQTEFVTNVASKLSGSLLYPWAFWHSIGGHYTAGNEPVFVEVGQSQKTNIHDITLGVSAPANEELIDRLYVGDTIYQWATEVYNEYATAEWHKQRRKTNDTTPASSSDEDSEEDLAF